MRTADRPASDPLARVRLRALLVLVLFSAIVFTKLLVLRWLVLGGGGLAGALYDAVFVLGVFAIVDLLFADIRWRAYIVTDIVFSVLLLAIAVYVEYYQLLPTRESLAAIGQAGDVVTSILELFRPALLLFFIELPFLFLWAWRATKRGVDVVTGVRPGAPFTAKMRTPYVYQRRAVYVVGALAVAFAAWNVNAVRASSGPLDESALSRQRGLTTYLVASALGRSGGSAAVVADDPLAVQAQIDALRGEPTGKIDGFESGAAKGANVVVIQVEALQTLAIGATMGGEEVTPNLNRLIERSWYFPNHMSVIGRGTTSDAEFASVTSLYPPAVGAASMLYVDRTLPSLPRMLSDSSGYDSLTFHTNSAEFWNRTQLYDALGYDRYYDDDYFGTADKIAFGASDRVLFDKTLDQLEARAKEGTPFYAQLVTMSSHFPFTEVPARERTLDPAPPVAGTIEGDYLTEINYVDRMIGEFMAQLEKRGLADKTMVVIFGDHFGLPEARKPKEEAALMGLLGREYGPIDRLSTPLIVHLPGQTEGAAVTTPVSQVDVAPTIADALGVDLSGMPHVGRSAFDTGPVLFSAGGLMPVGSYVDEKILFIPGDTFASGQAFDIETRQPVPLSMASEEKYERVKKLLALSDAYVKSLPERSDYDAAAKRVLPSEDLALQPDARYVNTHPQPYSWVDAGWVAHGMGGIEGKRVTNAFEAFKANYDRGFRVFEVDLIPATDGTLVARYDWEAYLYEFLGQKVDNPYKKLSTTEFKALKIHGDMTPLTIDDVVAIMRAYPDVWIMTDTKGTTEKEATAAMKEIVRAMGSDTVLAERMIIQIYNEPMAATVRAVYPFKNIVYNLYQQDGTVQDAVGFAAASDIRLVALPLAAWDPAIARQAKAAGIGIGVYTTNDAAEASTLRDQGAAIVYTDFLAPQD